MNRSANKCSDCGKGEIEYRCSCDGLHLCSQCKESHNKSECDISKSDIPKSNISKNYSYIQDDSQDTCLTSLTKYKNKEEFTHAELCEIIDDEASNLIEELIKIKQLIMSHKRLPKQIADSLPDMCKLTMRFDIKSTIYKTTTRDISIFIGNSEEVVYELPKTENFNLFSCIVEVLDTLWIIGGL